MDIIKVAKTPGTVGPVIRDPHNPKWPEVIEGDGIGGIKHLSGWEDYVPSGWPKPAPEGDGGDSEGYITDGGWDAHSGDWGFKGDDDGAEELFARDVKWWKDGDKDTWGIKHLGDTTGPKHDGPPSPNIGGGTGGSGIILKVSTEYGGRTSEDISGGVEESIDGSSWFGGSDYISGEGLLIGGTNEGIDADDLMGHTCPFIGDPTWVSEKDFGVQPRT